MTPRMRIVTSGFLRHLHQLRHALRPERAQVQAVELALVPVEEIEAADLVRAVVRAVAGADAPVVGHDVQALVVVHGGVDRADHLAGRQFALHAGDRLERDLGILGNLAVALAAEGRGVDLAVGIVAVEPDPVHRRGRGATWSLPTIGMLFSAWQATTQALQPMQVFRSMLMPHWCTPSNFGVCVERVAPRDLGRALARASSLALLADQDRAGSPPPCRLPSQSRASPRYSSRLASRTMSRPSIDQCSWRSARTIALARSG